MFITILLLVNNLEVQKSTSPSTNTSLSIIELIIIPRIQMYTQIIEKIIDKIIEKLIDK